MQQQLMLAEAIQEAALQSFQQRVSAYSHSSQPATSVDSQEELLRHVGCARLRAALIDQQSGWSAVQGGAVQAGSAATPLLLVDASTSTSDLRAAADASSDASSAVTAANADARSASDAAGVDAYNADTTEYYEDYSGGSVASRAAYANLLAAGRSSATSAAAANRATGVSSSSSSSSSEGHLVRLLEDDDSYSDDDAAALEALAKRARASMSAAAATASTSRASSSAASAAAAAAAVSNAAGPLSTIVAANAWAGGVSSSSSSRNEYDPEEEMGMLYMAIGKYLARGEELQDELLSDDEQDGYDAEYEQLSREEQGEYDDEYDSGPYGGVDDDEDEEDIMMYDAAYGNEFAVVYDEAGQVLPMTSAMLSQLQDDELLEDWADYLEWSYAYDMMYLDGDVDVLYLGEDDGGGNEGCGRSSQPAASAMAMMAHMAQMVAWARLTGADSASQFDPVLSLGPNDGPNDAPLTTTLYLMPGDAAGLAAVFNIGGPEPLYAGGEAFGEAREGEEEEAPAGLEWVDDLDLHWVRRDGSVNWGLVTLVLLTGGVAAMAVGAAAAWLSLRATVRGRWVYVPQQGGRCGQGQQGGSKSRCGAGLDAPAWTLRPEDCCGAARVGVVSAAEYVAPVLCNESVAKALAK